MDTPAAFTATLTYWQVFKQDAVGKPHQAVGGVYAADASHALMNARHVFVRRPSAVSLWVIDEALIFARTLEQLNDRPLAAVAVTDPLAVAQSYLVFRKSHHKRSMTFMDYCTNIAANSPAAALALACAEFGPAAAWWVLAEAAVTKSRAEHEAVETWFAPAKDKTYRQQVFYASTEHHLRQEAVKKPDYGGHDHAE
jgi:ring-1,2-phenylacetyl-CoA epoxidase subunit PaaB